MTQAIQKTLRDSAGMRWTALLLLALAMFCSYIFMDILSPIKDLMQETRGWDSTAFGTMQGKKLTGSGNDNIIEMFRYLDSIGKAVWIRHVLVPGISDDDAALTRTRDFIRTLGNIRRVEILPYHTLGVMKYKQLGIPYPLEGVPGPTPERVENARRILECDRYTAWESD